MTLDEHAIEGLIRTAGYDRTTPLAVGVTTPATVLVSQPGGVEADGFDCGSVGYAGSLAKQVTGACAVVLAHGGALDVEAPIARWLPELPGWAERVRVRHLVHHTAALPTTDAVWEQMASTGESDWTSDGAIAALSTIDELEELPGTGYAYSNVGYICLARIVERIARLDLGRFARVQLFAPLGMRTTTFWSGPSPAPPAATHVRPLGPPAPLSLGDGGLWTSVRDLLRWNEALAGDRFGISGTMHRPGTLDDGTPLDYAWGVRVFRVGGHRVESHGGSWEGATAKLVRLPELGRGFAALAGDGSVERMTALSALLQDELLRAPTARQSSSTHDRP